VVVVHEHILAALPSVCTPQAPAVHGGPSRTAPSHGNLLKEPREVQIVSGCRCPPVVPRTQKAGALTGPTLFAQRAGGGPLLSRSAAMSQRPAGPLRNASTKRPPVPTVVGYR
jgi:hypothetical protein